MSPVSSVQSSSLALVAMIHREHLSSDPYTDSGCGRSRFVTFDLCEVMVHFPRRHTCWRHAVPSLTARQTAQDCGFAAACLCCVALRHIDRVRTHVRSAWRGPIIGTSLRAEKGEEIDPKVEHTLAAFTHRSISTLKNLPPALPRAEQPPNPYARPRRAA
jgi:hypothetical protein